MIWPFNAAPASTRTAYDFTFAPLTGSADIRLADYHGKVILIVNTASKCGFTPQYAGLEKLYQTYRERGLVVIGVPSDDFGHQEPGSSDEIASFCAVNYGVSFPMTAKTPVTGDSAHPFYKWAREVLGVLATPKWNFHKFLIDRDGKLVDFFISTTGPDDRALVRAIETRLP